ncbi:hypothetical protein CDL12_11395 [Handroanthus impetiginosus]|uniref:Seipin n=1 Tax=Handroanthus impetiginosus TaxID=429701 RepID=A0A2G9HEI3_9LAMI|nr:hypothetical protein CDL12_11395 [Handroanthus impetiginosus]
MDDSRNIDDIDENNDNFLEFPYELGSQNLAHLMKSSLLLGADKLLMVRKAETLALSDFEPQNDNEPNSTSETSKIKGKYASKQSKNVSEKRTTYEITSTRDNFLTVIVPKLFGYQISLFLKFFKFPIWFSNFCLMFLMFPFQTITGVRDQMKKKLIMGCNFCFLKLISFTCEKFKFPKSVLKLAVRFGRGFFCAAYVFLVLIGLLISGFFIGGFILRNLVEESIHKTEIMNFDYTQTSPSAVVPINKLESISQRAIPYNRKLQLSVSLTLPESEYNRKLGAFQFGSSKPYHSVPLITGLKSEVQNIRIVIGEFIEGYKPTSSFKVILEQTAAFEVGSDIFFFVEEGVM